MRAPLLLCIFVAACEPAGTALPPDAVILPGNMVSSMLDQCARDTPPSGDGTWMPGIRDIAALEAALPTAVQAERLDGSRSWSRAPQGWQRQYVGIVRGGRRLIYGNFLPGQAAWANSMDDRWRHEAVSVCEQDPTFFGAEYDVEAARFTHFRFNGSL